jgi:putative chitinase
MLLKIGSTGDSVKALQQKLGLNADGVFGVGTEKAVKDWQKSNGITADGVVGPTTWQKIGLGSETVNENVDSPNKGELDLSKLKGHIPESVLAQIPDTAKNFNINTPLALAHFLAQCSHESGGFRIVSENLNYSADGLKRIFTKYFPDTLSESYAKNPQKIANKVYANRMGNGNEASGEGYKFRGRGFIQLTGKDNYKTFGTAINEDILNNPDLVSTTYPLLSAGWFFQRCLPKCKDASNASVEAVTRCVNGGTIGLDQRIKEFKTFYNLLS